MGWENVEIIERQSWWCREPYYEVWGDGKFRFTTTDKDHLTNIYKPQTARKREQNICVMLVK